MLIKPHRICHLIGHKRAGYDPDGHPDNWRPRGRRRWYSRCDRCGTTDGGEVYREGLLERFSWWRLRGAWRDLIIRARQWVWLDCTDCGMPVRRWGRWVGQRQHNDDNHLPF